MTSFYSPQASRALGVRVARVVAAVQLFSLMSVAPAIAQQRRFDLSDLGRIVRVTDPQISPDGRRILILVSRVNYEQDRFDTQLLLLDAPSGAQRVLIQGRGGLGHVRWSPAGDRIAFLAGTGMVAGRQVFVMTVSGGEARAVTNAPSGVQQFAWSPDALYIAFTTAEVPEPRTGVERHNNSFEVGDNDYLTTAPPRSTHIWLIPVDGGAARRLTSGQWSVATGLASPAISWSPDGKSIAFTKFPGPHSGLSDQGTVQIVDVATGQIRALTGGASRENSPAFSPDGSHIAFSAPRDGDPANINEVVVAPASSGRGVSVTRALDRSITSFVWAPDGKGLIVSANESTRVGAWIQPLSGVARRLNLGPVRSSGPMSVSKDGELALIGSESGRPSELYLKESTIAAPRRLTDFNSEIAALALGKTETIEWQSSDGFQVNGVLTYPPDFDAKKRYPLVLLIHGGPTATSTEAFSSRAQLMAARNWIVFQPNYRGSDNLGNAFQRAIANDAAEGPGRDIVAGIAAVKKLGFVDESRVALSGWSYGGFLTAWLIGRYQGWRAAVAGAAPVDITDMYSLSDLNVMRRHAITDSPWVGDKAPKYYAQSPIAHLSKIRTPTLIMSTTGDVRVPVVGSYKLYRALRDNGVPVKFVVYPGGGHSPNDPVRARDVDRRWLEWLGQYLYAGGRQ
jgi:dipeptidyl aminopeptidase/acylaminoacyl peptidase